MSCELSRQCEWIFLHLILTLPARRDDSDRREKGGGGAGVTRILRVSSVAIQSHRPDARPIRQMSLWAERTRMTSLLSWS